MPREGDNSDVRWFDIEPCYVFHPLNAYSEIRDGARGAGARRGALRRGCSTATVAAPATAAPTLDRWTINLATGAVSTERRDDRSQEFPRINETLLGSRHRFGYTVGVDGGFVTQATSRNVARRCTSTTTRPDRAWSPRSIPSLLIGEMSFVPDPPPVRRAREDDGILMGYGYHRGRDEGQLLLLDAQTLRVDGDRASAAASTDGLPRQLGAGA